MRSSPHLHTMHDVRLSLSFLHFTFYFSLLFSFLFLSFFLMSDCDCDSVTNNLRDSANGTFVSLGRFLPACSLHANNGRDNGRDVTAGLHASWAQDGLEHDVHTQQRQAVQHVGPFSSTCYDIRR